MHTKQNAAPIVIRNAADALAQLDLINERNPGTIQLTLTAAEASNIGALLERNAVSMLPAVLQGDELAIRLAGDSADLAHKLRTLAVACWGL